MCILAYGQTGSGKTYTMEGPDLSMSTNLNENSGILPKAVDFIFKEIKRLEVQQVFITLELACLEIYNDNLSDLLSNDIPQTNEKEQPNKLGITFTGSRVLIHNLTYEKITDMDQLLKLINKASKYRATEKTTWNERYFEGDFFNLIGLQEVIVYIG